MLPNQRRYFQHFLLYIVGNCQPDRNFIRSSLATCETDPSGKYCNALAYGGTLGWEVSQYIPISAQAGFPGLGVLKRRDSKAAQSGCASPGSIGTLNSTTSRYSAPYAFVRNVGGRNSPPRNIEKSPKRRARIQGRCVVF